jgi:hypothetical protein
MNWLDLRLDIQERLNIDIASLQITTKPPEEISKIFNQLMTSNALQQKAIQQLTQQVFQMEAKQIEPRR